METYNAGQVRNIYPYLDKDTEHFLLGGPADGDEAQVLHTDYPNIRILAFEANSHYYLHQRFERKFPGQIFNLALWWKCTRGLMLRTMGDDKRSASLTKFDATVPGQETVSTTLDLMSIRFGPFKNSFLWLDIEGSELEALKGAKQILKAGYVTGLNVEVYQEYSDQINEFLSTYGFKEVHRWDEHFQDNNRHWWNAIYKKG